MQQPSETYVPDQNGLEAREAFAVMHTSGCQRLTGIAYLPIDVY